MAPSPTAVELHSKNLRQYGPARLSKLPDETLEVLCNLYHISPVPEVKNDRISALMKARQLTSSIAENPPQSEGAKEPVFKPYHGLRVMVFNSHKLRLGREALAEQWMVIVAEMALLDVVLISEVPAGDAHEKTRSMIALLRHISDKKDDEWNFAISDPSGPGNLEVHVVLVKAPVKILASHTISSADDGVKLDHSPLVVKLQDERFATSTTVVVTSVHFPPSYRGNERDQQLKSFFRSYAEQSGVRLNEPFTEKGAKDARLAHPLHIVAGDFNAHPSHKVPDLEKLGWGDPLIHPNFATSAGRQNYDNVVPDAVTASRFNMSYDILELQRPQNSRRKEIGLSDHYPIVVTI